jgi:hypothetical protein
MKKHFIFFTLLLSPAYAKAATFSAFSGNCDLIKVNGDGSISQTPRSFDLSGNSAYQSLEFVLEGIRYDVGVHMETELSPSEVDIGLSSPDNRNLIPTGIKVRDPIPGPDITFEATFSPGEYLHCNGAVH